LPRARQQVEAQLSITEKPGGVVLVKCFGGCDTEMVLAQSDWISLHCIRRVSTTTNVIRPFKGLGVHPMWSPQ
jgi:hypothetical protein